MRGSFRTSAFRHLALAAVSLAAVSGLALSGAARAQDAEHLAVPPEPQAPKPPPRLDVVPLGDDVYHAHVQSYAEIRFQGIERQSQDLSCGAAALATMMRYYFNADYSEHDIIKAVLTSAGPEDKAKIAQYGFSMLELKHFAESKGFVAGGFRTENPQDLRKLRAPAIALVNSRGYKHFVVIRHVRGDEVAIADPVFGNRIESLDKFAKRWNNVILVVVAPGRVVNSAFLNAPNTATDWRAVQLFASRYLPPPAVTQPGELF